MRRFVFAPRWVVGHVLVVAAVACCLFLGRWQLGRAEITHSLQNTAYALQWPLFAVFFAVMWLRMLRLESRRLDEEEAEQAEALEADPDREGVAAEPTPTAGPDPAEPPARPSPSRAEDDDDPELAAYNRMLAELAAQDAARRR